MAWMTLADALEGALASMMIDGEGVSVAADPEASNSSKRGPSTEALGQVGSLRCDVEQRREGETTAEPNDGRMSEALPIASRCGPAGNKRARPTLAAGQHLFVIEGGRPARGGGESRAAYARAPEGNRASKLVLVR